MRMLSNDDLQAIGAIVDGKLDQKLEPVLVAVRDGFEEMDRRWDEKLDKGLGSLRHELMEHADRTVGKAAGDLRMELKADIGALRSELRERDLIG